MARFIPFAPVGGTMCAASPARNSRPYCIGSTTKLRIWMMPFWKIGPASSAQPSLVASRACSSVQMRSSGQFVDRVGRIALKIQALNFGERVLTSAKPRS